ncbi:hypothetical protein BDY24DRAFT_389928 [Mrakia frigida]|uniref:TVP38/TMEM64 family protein n=1 Tax=Mrakia frigida TaxID=29902 RepID=UPI003FCC1350
MSSSSTRRQILTHLKALPDQSYDYVKSIPRRYRQLKTFTKLLIWILVLFHVVLISGIIAIGPVRIGNFFTRLAASIQALGAPGYLLVGGMVALSAIPPFFGFASSLTFAGFTYGLPRGIPIAFLGTLSGSSIAFFLYRYVFRKQFGKMMGTGANGGQGREGGKWEAFQAVVKSKSLPLLIALRWCPLPFALSNGFYASLEAVSYFHFLIATACMLPKTILVVYVGSRLDNLADSEAPHDRVSTLLNIGSIVLATVISFLTGWYIYHSLLLHLPQMPPIIPDPFLTDEENAARAGEGEALLMNFSDEDEEEGEVLPVQNGGLVAGGRGP